MNKIKHVLVLVLIVTGLLATNLINQETDFSGKIFEAKSVTVSTYQEKDYELRAVWVATAWNLNIGYSTNRAAYETEYKALINKVVSKNMNAIFFQVRPMNDAFYNSAYAPFSKYMTGIEDQDPGWDVMAFMIDYAHSRDVEFHAWMNPYRVITSSSSKSSILSTLSDKNFAKINPNLVISGSISDGLYPYILNPGEPEVKDYIVNVVEEIMSLYDIDGIHYDDYFYPYSGTPTSEDAATYSAYNPNGLTLENWRRQNVNDAVKGTFDAVEAHNTLNNKNVRFGISPFGIWKNGGEGSDTNGMQSFSSQYADSRRWVKEGWVHYINPQVYWTFTTGAAPYANVVNWWVDQVRGTGVDLIIGHSISAARNWGALEIQNQLLHNAQYPEIKGSAFYSASYLDTINVTNTVTNLWKHKPLGTLETSSVPNPTVTLDGTKVGDAYSTNITLTITSPHQSYYRIDNGTWMLYQTPVVFTNQGSFSLHVKAVDDTLKESLIQGFSLTIDKTNNDVPSITVTGNKLGNDYLPGAVVTVSAANMANLYVAVNHGSVGPWVKYTGPITLTDTGSYFVKTKTITSENVESTESTKSLKIVQNCFDKPVISFDKTGVSPFQSLAVSLTGQTALQYKINNEAWTNYTATLDFTENGDYTLLYRNDDGCKVEYETTFTIDTVAPDTPEITIVGEKSGLYYIEQTTASLSVSDGSVIYYRLHNGAIWTEFAVYVEPFVFKDNKTYTIEYYAKDIAGNMSETLDERFRMDLLSVEDNVYVERNGEYVTYYHSSTKVTLPTTYAEKEKEVRAVWVATVSNIDVPLMQEELAYKAVLTNMLDTVLLNRLNTIFFQVRPMNDAFYYSDYAPLSRYIMGTEGMDPGFDVLKFVVEEGHKRGIEVHAWLNPYRVSTGTESKAVQLDKLSDNNFAKQNPDLVISDKAGKLILNPGEPLVRAYLLNVVNELLSKYDIDGIHFDDYFYSYSGMNNDQDALSFSTHNPKNLNLDNWRRDNVNQLVESVHLAHKAHNLSKSDNAVFGISPFGIWLSGGQGSNTSTGAMQSFKDQYADSKKWVTEGYLDYIMPQLYWQFDHGSAPYADLVDWWANLCETSNVDLIIGHGFYRYAETSNNWTNESELLEQIRYASKYSSIIGSAYFSFKTFNSNDKEVVASLSRLLNHYYKTVVKTPWYKTGTVDPIDPVIPDPVCGDNESLINGVCVLNIDNKPLSQDTVIIIGSLSVGFLVVAVVFFSTKRRIR